MTEPLRSDDAADAADLPERDRDARVEELLLSGLDHYFNGQLELAINVWTRVLFIDRGHARARAYIERARSAVSERQREAEELIHAGAAAFQRGDVAAARRLLTSALERGAATEDAFSLLERLDRLEAAGVQQEARTGMSPPAPARVRRPSPDEEARRSRLVWIAAGAIFGVAAGTLAIALLWSSGGAWLAADHAVPPAAPVEREPLPVPAPAEVLMARAQLAFQKGRLREALTTLDDIRHGDPLQRQADELRALIQRGLLESGRGQDVASPVTGTAGTRNPSVERR